MAKIKAFPAKDIISGFKGKLDYYVHDGVPCVRRWPRSPGHRRAPAVEAQWSAFAYAAAEWGLLGPELKESYIHMAQGTGLTGRDYFTRAYLKGLWPHPKEVYGEMKLIILDDEIEIVATGPQGAGYAWTDFDLTPHVGVAATIVYLRARLKSWDVAGNSDAEFYLRQKGSSQGVSCIRWWTQHSRGRIDVTDLFVSMDANKFIQHKLFLSAGLTQVYTDVWVLGWME